MPKKEDATNKAFKGLTEMIKNHRKPCDENDKLAVESISMQKHNIKGIEVLNSSDAKTILSEVSIKVSPGGYEEVNGEQSQNNERQEIK